MFRRGDIAYHKNQFTTWIGVVVGVDSEGDPEVAWFNTKTKNWLTPMPMFTSEVTSIGHLPDGAEWDFDAKAR